MKLCYIYLFQHTHNSIKLGFLFCLDLGVIDTGNTLGSTPTTMCLHSAEK
jgi:hypothetical protein